MSKEINLLFDRNNNVVWQQKSLRIIRSIAIGSLVVLALFAVGIYLLGRFYSTSSLIQQQNVVLQQISSFNKKEAKLVLVNDRLLNINEILKNRKDYYAVINPLLSKIPDGAQAKNIEVSNNSVLLSVSAPSLLFLDGYINTLTAMAQRKEVIHLLELDSLELLEQEGIYVAILKAEF